MPDPVPTEEEADRKASEEAEQEAPEVQALREQLSSDIPLLLGQLTRVKQHCETRTVHLKEKCADIDTMFSRLTALKARIPRLSSKELSEARVDLRLATSCHRDVTAFLSPHTFGQRWLQAYLFLSTVLLGVVLYVGWATSCFGIEYNAARNATLCTVLYCACAGGLGGVTAAIRDFIYFSGKGLFDPNWVLSYRLRPLLGVIMGVVSWALLRGGVAAVAGPAGQTVALSNAAYFAIAFIAAFAVEQVGKKLYDIADTVFAVSAPRTKPR
ncbi:MAG: hypothetical protein JSV79_11140 [Armatimonadota bacterium]|nr:MAG: hypothetical protein JSV79_11140 [Armatimonadota bacterium]